MTKIHPILVARHDEIVSLRKQGLSYDAIGKIMGTHGTTIGIYVKDHCDIELMNSKRAKRSPESCPRNISDDTPLIMEAYFKLREEFPNINHFEKAIQIHKDYDYGYVTATGWRKKYSIATLVQLIYKISRELKK